MRVEGRKPARPFTAGEKAQINELAAKGYATGRIARLLGRSENSVYYIINCRMPAKRKARKGETVTCLRCRQPFVSEDRATNRVCKPCKHSEDWRLS